MLRALVVDDSRAMRSVLCRYLVELGYEVLEAGDGAQALRLLQDLHARGSGVDLALVDWNMPVLDGYELVKAVRSNRAFAAMTIIMVSAENDRSRIARALMAGADEYAMKPVTRDILVSKLALVGRA